MPETFGLALWMQHREYGKATQNMWNLAYATQLAGSYVHGSIALQLHDAVLDMRLHDAFPTQ